VLELNPNKVSQRLKDDLLSKYPITDNLGRTQQANFVNEDGLYDAIFDSRKKEARMFRKWVTSEVLPSIRKTGGYMVSKDEDTPEEIMARALQIAQSTLDRQKKRLAEQDLTIERQGHTIQEQSQQLQAAAPKVSYYDDTLMSTNTMTMTQVANSIGMSVHSLTNKLLKAGIIYRQSGQLLLRVPYCNCGLHKTRTNTFTHSDGRIGTSIYTVWTQKGVRFINALCSNGFNVKAAVAVMRRETTPVAATC
jgi:prophage antirepressor-like protein